MGEGKKQTIDKFKNNKLGAMQDLLLIDLLTLRSNEKKYVNLM
jgi:hypothetical protein